MVNCLSLAVEKSGRGMEEQKAHKLIVMIVELLSGKQELSHRTSDERGRLDYRQNEN